MKNNATPTPITNCTVATWLKSTCKLKFERKKLVNDKKIKATVASMRRSNRSAYLPTNGVINTGRMPIGAVARPARMAV